MWPALTAVGIFLNCIAFALMLRQAVRKNSTSVYFATLAISDTATLVCDLILKAVSAENMLPWGCPVLFYGYFVFPIYSAWVVVGVERAIVVTFPLKCRFMLSNTRARKVCLSLFLVTALAMSHWIWTSDHGSCDVALVFAPIALYLRLYTSLALIAFVPLSVLTVATCVMVISITIAIRKRKQLSGTNVGSSVIKTTIPVLVVCMFSLITNMPLTIYTSIKISGGAIPSSSAFDPTLVHVLLEYLTTFNYCFNLLLYVLPGGQYRQEFLAMITSCRRIKYVERS